MSRIASQLSITKELEIEIERSSPVSAYALFLPPLSQHGESSARIHTSTRGFGIHFAHAHLPGLLLCHFHLKRLSIELTHPSTCAHYNRNQWRCRKSNLNRSLASGKRYKRSGSLTGRRRLLSSILGNNNYHQSI